MSITDSIFVGVINGILTSALLFIVVQIIRKIVIPWYQSLIYRGTDINGDWITNHPTANQIHKYHIDQHMKIFPAL
jgi:hypothetical protein